MDNRKQGNRIASNNHTSMEGFVKKTKGEKNTVMQNDIIIVKKEIYSGCSIHFLKKLSPQTTDTQKEKALRDAITNLLETWKKGAIWVEMTQEEFLKFGKILLTLKFKFHRCNPKDQNFVYYRWNLPNVEDKVPPFATSIEGSSCFLVSRDKREVLVVGDKKTGKVGFPGGSVDYGEFSYEGALRELKEETGLTGEPLEIGLLRIGGYNAKHARYGAVNDNYSVWVFRITENCTLEKNLKLEAHEISFAKFVPITDLADGKVPKARPNAVFWAKSYLDHFQHLKETNTAVLEGKNNRIVY